MAGGRNRAVEQDIAAGDSDAVWQPVNQREEPSDLQLVRPARHGHHDGGQSFHLPVSTGRAMRYGFVGLLDGLRDRIAAAWLEERERGISFLLLPVFFGLGCILYFSLPREPLAGALAGLAGLLTLIAWWVGDASRFRLITLLIAFLAAGIACAQWRTTTTETRMLGRSVVADVAGRVAMIEQRANGRVRYTLDIAGEGSFFLARGIEDPPGRIRLSARSVLAGAAIGSMVTGRARVGAPSGPAYPGGYDFAFHIWLAGIGGSGFFLGAPELIEVETRVIGFDAHVAKARHAISSLLRTALPGEAGGLAAALIVGDRSGIPQETAEALRESGLAHILAISGLHMGLVALTVIWLVRLIGAAVPQLALHYPIRKWAAAAALLATTGYVVISGGSVSAQRAYIMISIMLVALLFDRRALTMRNVAIAALAVLFLAPHAILTPGFQMSFAAVSALVATYEALTRRKRMRRSSENSGFRPSFVKSVLRPVGGLALTSLIAGIATGLFAAYHFHRVAPLGLLANLLAMPLVSLAVMPAALFSMLLMPFGLEGPALAALETAIQPVVAIARWVAGLQGAGATGIVSVFTTAAGTVALLLATLFKTRLRWLALVPLALGLMSLGMTERPDVLVHENGQQIGVFDDDEGMRLLRPRAGVFTTTIWQRAFAPSGNDTLETNNREPGENGFQCDAYGCATRVKGRILVHLTQTGRLDMDCRLADIIVIPYRMAKVCAMIPEAERPVIIEGRLLARRGAHALRIDDGGSGAVEIAVETAFDETERPWSRHRK